MDHTDVLVAGAGRRDHALPLYAGDDASACVLPVIRDGEGDFARM